MGRQNMRGLLKEDYPFWKPLSLPSCEQCTQSENSTHEKVAPNPPTLTDIAQRDCSILRIVWAGFIVAVSVSQQHGCQL